MTAPPAARADRIRRYVEEELRAAATYRALAQRVEGRPRRTLERLAVGEERHALAWADIARRLGIEIPTDTPRAPLRARWLAWLAARVGLLAVVPLLERHEGAEIDRYAGEEQAPAGIVDEEREHAALLATLAPALADPGLGRAARGHVRDQRRPGVQPRARHGRGRGEHRAQRGRDRGRRRPPGGGAVDGRR